MINNYSNNTRNNNFGTIHLMGAFFVLYGHQCALLNVSGPAFLGQPIQTIGVRIIFLISGYLITRSLFREKNKYKCLTYVIKRLSRIYPELFFCLICTALLIGAMLTNIPLSEYFRNPETTRYVLKNLMFYPVYGLPGVFQQNPYLGAVNGSLWTIPVEIAGYIFLLLLTIAAKKLNANGVVAGWVVSFCIVLLVKNNYFSNVRIVIYGTDWVDAMNIIPYMIIGGGGIFCRIVLKNT